MTGASSPAPASPDGQGSIARTGRTIVTLSLEGKSHTVDLSAGVTDDLVAQLASELNRPASDVRNILNAALAKASSVSSASSDKPGVISRTVHTAVGINLDSKQRIFNTSSGITDDLINQIASETNLPASEVRGLVDTAMKQGVAERIDIRAQRPSTPAAIKQTTCPQCHHTTPATDKCMYCGYPLADSKR